MRKMLRFFVPALLILSLLAGCGGAGGGGSSSGGSSNGGAASKEKAWKAGDKIEMILATGGTGGTYYPLGGGMGKLWADNIPGVNVTVQSTGASVVNVRMLAKSEVELALIQNDTADYGYNGTEAFAAANEKYSNYKAIGALYPEVVQIVVRADSDIKSVSDLKGKKVVVGAAGSGTEIASRQILTAYGIDYDKEITKLPLSFAEGATQFKDKQADALVMVTGVPAASLADVQTATDVRLVPIDLAKVSSNFKFYVKHTVKAGTYKGVTQDTDVVAVLAILVVREDMNSDLVYQMTKTLFEKAGDIGHAKAKEFDVKKAGEGITIPFHPGAAKYLNEKGVNVK